MATFVNTTAGQIPPSQLGVTLFHEHLVSGIHGRDLVDVGYFDTEHAFDQCCLRVRQAMAAGITTIVDVTPIDLGRNVDLDRRVAEATGMQIVCATGLHNQRLGHPTWIRGQTADGLAEIFVREIEQGMRGTGIRAGVIKVATGSRELRSSERRALVAAARAQRATGVPIITHTDHGELAHEQIDIFGEEGADLSKVVIGHVEPLTPDAAEALLRRGVALGYDRIGHPWIIPDEQRASQLAELVRRGWADRMLLSQDHNVASALDAHTDHTPKDQRWRADLAFAFIHERFYPMAEAAGLARESLNHMLTGNVAALWA